MQLVFVRAGTFAMGSPAAEPERENNETQYEVTLESSARKLGRTYPLNIQAGTPLRLQRFGVILISRPPEQCNPKPNQVTQCLNMAYAPDACRLRNPAIWQPGNARGRVQQE